MAGIGFCTGIAGPSRDLLVRRAATARFGQAAYGRVYGFVYSGLDLGLALAPVIFGTLMDGQRFGAVLVGIAVLQTLGDLHRPARRQDCLKPTSPRAQAGRRCACSGAAMACRTCASRRALSAPSVPLSTSQLEA